MVLDGITNASGFAGQNCERRQLCADSVWKAPHFETIDCISCRVMAVFYFKRKDG
jgi:hypothetical protein